MRAFSIIYNAQCILFTLLGVPKFITYGSNTCTAGVTTSTFYPSVCSAGSTYTWPQYPTDDDYLPPAYTPPSVSSTPYPTQISPITSTIQYCTNNRPTMMPAVSPTVFPTATSAVQVDVDVVQVRQPMVNGSIL